MIETALVERTREWVSLHKGKISSKDTLHQLLVMEKEFQNFRIDENKITVTSDEVIFHPVNFGKFDVSLLIGERNFTGMKRTVRYKALTPVFPKYAPGYSWAGSSATKFVHPHIHKEGWACWGGLELILPKQIKHGCLIEAMTTAVDFVGNLHLKHEAAPLSSWSSVKHPCRDCGEFLTPKQIEICEECHESFCKSCIKRCLVCKVRICPTCRTEDFREKEGEKKIFFCSDCAHEIESRAR